MLEKLFSMNKETASHITIICFGIKFHILRPELRKQRKSFSEKYNGIENIKEVPKAQGNLRLIQLANLGLLKQFDKICKENSINYWLDFGTLLGAQRHKGFIPWDDDIDIGMPRDDYEKFIQLFREELPMHPDLYYSFSCNGRNKCFIKLRHKKTNNIFIDIFPYDYAPSMTKEEKAVFSQKIAKLIKPKFFKYFKTEEATRAHLRKITKKLVNTDEKGSLFWGLDFPHKWANKVYDYSQIFPLKDILFEDTYFPAPNNPDEVLTSIYGNYMSIPRDVYPRHSQYNLHGSELELIKNFAKGEK